MLEDTSQCGVYVYMRDRDRQKGQGQEELSPEGSYHPFLPPSEMRTKGVTKQ